MCVYFQHPDRNLGELAWIYLHLKNMSVRVLPSKYVNIQRTIDRFTEASTINTVLYILCEYMAR